MYCSHKHLVYLYSKLYVKIPNVKGTLLDPLIAEIMNAYIVHINISECDEGFNCSKVYSQTDKTDIGIYKYVHHITFIVFYEIMEVL